MLLSLMLVLFLGASWCDAREPIRFNDGKFAASTEFYERILYIQEGAVIDITCEGPDVQPYNLAVLDLIAQFYYGFDFVNTHWTLTSASYGENIVKNVEDWVGVVDPDEFPNHENWEAYHEYWTYDEPEYFWAYHNRHLSTIRYTARKEDDNKVLACRPFYEDVDPKIIGSFILVVRPAPTPLTFHSSVLHKWRGGFVGELHIPISDYYNSWKIILEFPKKVYSLEGGRFQVANEPCLHRPDCGDDRKQTWVIYNTFDNRVLNPGDHLNLIFVASTWKKVDRGLKATAHFYGYNQVYHSETEPESSSSDIHVKFSASSSSSSSSSEEPIFAVPL